MAADLTPGAGRAEEEASPLGTVLDVLAAV